MNYPNGQKRMGAHHNHSEYKQDFGNRGMSLEEDINVTNQYYLEMDKAVIHKKPTPIQIVKVDYPRRSAATIKEGYFKQASTTDYNGLYRGKYVDFEAKETKSKTSFPLSNVHDHQVEHMKSIVHHGGISFMIIRFSFYNETFLMPAERLFKYWKDKDNGGRKSIAYSAVKENSYIIPVKYQARVDYLAIIDSLYF